MKTNELHVGYCIIGKHLVTNTNELTLKTSSRIDL